MLRKSPGFQARDRQLLPWVFCSSNFAGSTAPGSALAHVQDSFLVTGTVPCSQSKAVRGAVVRCPRELGCPQSPGLESLQLQSSFPHTLALAQPIPPVWSTKGVDPATPRALWEYSVIERSQINQAGLGSFLEEPKTSVPDVRPQLEYPP